MADNGLDDAEVIKRVLEGDVDAFEVLVRRYQEHLFRLLSRHLPQVEVAEAAQEAFLDAFQNLSRLRDVTKFRSWLSAIALRRGADIWRATSRRMERSMDFSNPEELAWLEEAMLSDSRERFDGLADQREASKLVELLMADMSVEDRLALELFYAEEYGVSEIGKMLGWGQSKVKVRLHRARKKMAKKFEALTGRRVK